MKMKVHRFKQTAGSGSSQELDREQYSKVKLVVPNQQPPFYKCTVCISDRTGEHQDLREK